MFRQDTGKLFPSFVYICLRVFSHLLEEGKNLQLSEMSLSSHLNTYTQRAHHFPDGIAKKLLLLMDQKNTNLSVAADVTTSKELFDLIENVGPHICVLKVS